MAQIKITVDIDDAIGDISISIDEVQANGIKIMRHHDEELA